MAHELTRYEEERKKLYSRHKILMSVVAILILAGIILTIILRSVFVLIIASIISLAIVIFSSVKIYNFSQNIKENLIKDIIDNELGNATYLPRSGISLPEVMAPGLFKKPDKYSSEDYLSAVYKGISFTAADIHLEEKHTSSDSDGNTQQDYATYFKGRFIIFEFERNLDLVVKCLETTRLGAQNKGLTKVETESLAFNKKFKTFANTSHDAFYILTPGLQEKMLQLEKMFHGTIFFAFIHGKFYLAINDNNISFRIRISKPIDERFIEEIKNQIHLAPFIIDEFDLNSNKFKADI